MVSTSDLEVLVKSSLCGHLDPSIADASHDTREITYLGLATTYARDCYQDQATPSVRCKSFMRPRIKFNTETVACPFSAEYCFDEDSKPIPAVAFDSGLVDLNDGFGANFAKNDRVSYRRRTTCSILPLRGHISIINGSDLPEKIMGRKAWPFEEVSLLHYGERPTAGEWKNITTSVSLMAMNMTKAVALL